MADRQPPRPDIPRAGSAGEPSPAAAEAEELVRLANTVMPFGRYRGRRLPELPEPYLVWFHGQGFPKGDLGRQLALLHEIKVNGLEYLLEPLIDRG